MRIRQFFLPISIFSRPVLFSFALLFIASFVAHFIVFRSHDVLAAFVSNKERNLICKG